LRYQGEVIGYDNLRDLKNAIDDLDENVTPLVLTTNTTGPSSIIQTYKGFAIRKWGDRYDTAFFDERKS